MNIKHVDIWSLTDLSKFYARPTRVVNIGYRSIADTVSAIVFKYRAKYRDTFLIQYRKQYRRYFLHENIRYLSDTFFSSS